MASTTPNGSGLLIALRVAFVVAVLSISMVVVVNAANDKHNLSAGNATRFDRLLFRNTTKVNGSIFRQKTGSVCFRPAYRVNITAYNVTDLMPRGKGGYPSLVTGGINDTKACFHLKSQLGKGYHFQTYIWGH